MTTTTRLPGRDAAAAHRAPARKRRGFTLVEIMIGATISSFILAGVLSAYLFIVRSGVNLGNYSEMESQARSALELFAEDTRQASSITWNSRHSVTLVVSGNPVVYQYDASAGTFQRVVAGQTRTLLRGIQSFEYRAYSIASASSGTELPLATAADLTAAGKSTKQLQLSLTAARTNQTVTRATNTVLSARFILRNKKVTT